MVYPIGCMKVSYTFNFYIINDLFQNWTIIFTQQKKTKKGEKFDFNYNHLHKHAITKTLKIIMKKKQKTKT